MPTADEIKKHWSDVEKKLSESTKELYGKKGFEPKSEPLHKNAKVEIGKEGSKNADELDPSQKMETVPKNKSKEGAEEAVKEFEGNKKETGQPGVDKKEGAAGGAADAKKVYCKAFREKVRGVFGLPLDDKLNKPKGLEK